MKLHQLISLSSGLLAVFLNLLLLPIILTFSSKMIGTYKYLLFLYTLAAVIYATSQVLTLPTFLIFDNGYIFYSSVHWFSKEISSFFIGVFMTFYCVTVTIVCLSFIYRYGVLCSKRVRDWFVPGYQLLALILVTLLVIGISSAGAVNLEFYYLRYHTPIPANFDTTLAHVIGFIHQIDGRGLKGDMLGNLVTASLLAVISTIINGFCVYKIVKRIRTTNERRRQMEIRLLVLLILQTMFPIIFNGIPLVSTFLMAFCGMSSDYLPEYLGSLMSIAQVIDPILVFLFISEYHTKVFKMLRSRRPFLYQSNAVGTTPSNTTS